MNRRARKLNNKGYTLVELIVSFALLGIIMAAGTLLIVSCSSIYYYSKEESEGLQVSEMVLDIVRGKLQRAYEQIPGENYSVIIEGDRVDFASNGERITLSVAEAEDGRYLAEFGEDVSLCLPKEAYMGFSIAELKFTWLKDQGYPDYMIKAELKLEDMTHSEFVVTEYISLEYLKGNTERITGV